MKKVDFNVHDVVVIGQVYIQFMIIWFNGLGANVFWLGVINAGTFALHVAYMVVKAYLDLTGQVKVIRSGKKS